jgi:phosphoglycolate phosphatase
MERPSLVLFDIDGTLIRRAGPAHRHALEEAVLRVTGLSVSTAEIPVQGMLDRDIVRTMLEQAGASRTRCSRAMPEIVRTAQELYLEGCPDLRRKVCPGVRRLLGSLDRSGAVLGLVTGNLSGIGWRKMERAGLKPHFRFGAFAEDGGTRAELARLALRNARKQGWIGDDGAVTLVGDHPNDIAAARANGIRSVAVGTGVVSMEDLAAHKPDLLVPDMRLLDVRHFL